MGVGRRAVEEAWQLGVMLRYDECSVPSKEDRWLRLCDVQEVAEVELRYNRQKTHWESFVHDDCESDGLRGIAKI